MRRTCQRCRMGNRHARIRGHDRTHHAGHNQDESRGSLQQGGDPGKRRQDSQEDNQLDEDEEHMQLVSHDEADQILMETTEKRITHLQQAIKLLSADEQLLLQLYYTEQRSLRDISFIIDSEKPLVETDTRRMENQLAQRLNRIRKKLSMNIKKMEKDEKQ